MATIKKKAKIAKAKAKAPAKAKVKTKAKAAKPKMQTKAKAKAKAATAPKAAKMAKAVKAVKTTAPKIKVAIGLKLFSPLDDRVLVQPEKAAEKTPGGLYIPDTVQERPLEGKIVSVGPGHRNKKGRLRPLDVKLGDRIMYSAHAGSSVDLDGQEFLLLREEEILAVLNK